MSNKREIFIEILDKLDKILLEVDNLEEAHIKLGKKLFLC